MAVKSGDSHVVYMQQEEVVGILRALGVEMLQFTLSGGGDSGACDIEEIVWRTHHDDGGPVTQVRLASIPHLNGCLESELCTAAAEWPEMDWVNNVGGYGSIIIQPFADDPDERVSIDMNYNEEDQDDLGEDPELGDELDLQADAEPKAGKDGTPDGTTGEVMIEDLPDPVGPRR
jgi:hypothetical protein